jgi:hypothetical protein
MHAMARRVIKAVKMTLSAQRRPRRRLFFLVGGLILLLALPSHARAATAGATVGVSVTIDPQLMVEGGLAGADVGHGRAPTASGAQVIGGGVDTSTTLATAGVPFAIRVRSNAPWRCSARVENSEGLLVPLQCVCNYRAVQTFGGTPAGPTRVELGPVGRDVAGAPQPRGEVVIEGRVLAPGGRTPRVPWKVTLVWLITQESTNPAQPLNRTIRASLGDRGAVATVPSAP